MKLDPPDFLTAVAGKLTTNLAAYVAGAKAWPVTYSLGEWKGDALRANFPGVPVRVDAWRRWAREHDVELRSANRRVGVSAQVLITHVVVPDLDAAARICGGAWPAAVRCARERAEVLTEHFAHLRDPAALAGALARVMELDEVAFDVAVNAGVWFAAAGDVSSLTPRQVPLEGTDAKWLQSHKRVVATLAGRESLELAAPHPPRVHFTYLDPQHLRSGGRRHDSVTLGDRVVVAYEPRVVVISENKDTAVHFPQMASAIAVEGGGSAAVLLAAVDFIADADLVVYWGDLDAEGFEILNQLRACGLVVTSMLMDAGTWARYMRYGTKFDKSGRPILPRAPKAVAHLTASEQQVYLLLCSEAHVGPRRLEQERIPLRVAANELVALASAKRTEAANSVA